MDNNLKRLAPFFRSQAYRQDSFVSSYFIIILPFHSSNSFVSFLFLFTFIVLYLLCGEVGTMLYIKLA